MTGYEVCVLLKINFELKLVVEKLTDLTTVALYFIPNFITSTGKYIITGQMLTHS